MLGETHNQEIRDLRDMDDEDITNAIDTNPNLERALARGMISRQLRKQEHVPEAAAYSWRKGTELDDIPQETLDDSKYVESFSKEREAYKKLKNRFK
jgi:hypothetical protein